MARASDMELLTGSSGFSYKEWKGPFYPDDLPAKQMLEYYAGRLGTVEINNTFYRLPRRDMLESWTERVPSGFRFAIKASRRITHMKRLANCEEETGYLLSTLEALGERLGSVLFQLPPNMKADLGRLGAFLELLPEGTTGAFEFRNPSWFDSAVLDALRARNMALVWADTDKDPNRDWPTTADWIYARLRRDDYGDDDLVRWCQRLKDSAARRAFVYFKHEDEGAAPNLALRMKDLMTAT